MLVSVRVGEPSRVIQLAAANTRLPVLMNLIGNAVKFTANGFVRVTCAVDSSSPVSPTDVCLKFSIQYVFPLRLGVRDD